MAGNIFGSNFRVMTFGESHGVAMGCVIDGCPAGVELSEVDIQAELDKRKPGQSAVSTARQEEDLVQIVSGVFKGKTLGTPIAMLVWNKDQRSQDYSDVERVFRPAHGDFTYQTKFGIRDYRGGGRGSGRETVARVMGGAVAKKVLKELGVEVVAYTKEIAGIEAVGCDLGFIGDNPVRSCCRQKAVEMEEAILRAKEENDSVGGVVEVKVLGLEGGVGSPVFAKLEGLLAMALMSIGSVKGVEVGSGFAASKMRGSEHNDNILSIEDKKIKFEKNYSGGVLGGMSTGDEIVCRCAFKPTSSIKQEQMGANEDGELEAYVLEGRHDPCIVPRAVSVVESMVSLVILDELMANKMAKLSDLR